MGASDIYNRDWITKEAQAVIAEYSDGITLRQLYYRLVARGMINDVQHYKRVIGAMTEARWKDVVSMSAFIDRERSVFGETKAEEKDLDEEIHNAEAQVKAWMTGYHLERWSNQPNYVEVWIEKKALQGVFEGPCARLDVALAPCKGYPSITFLHEAAGRFTGIDHPIILYFGDYDPSGEDIPRSIKENLSRMGYDVEVERIALNPDLIEELDLPSVPPKQGDSRTRNWDGKGVVELDAVEPKLLKKMCEDAIENKFDDDLFDELETKEEKERIEYIKRLKKFVNGLKVKEDE